MTNLFPMKGSSQPGVSVIVSEAAALTYSLALLQETASQLGSGGKKNGRSV